MTDLKRWLVTEPDGATYEPVCETWEDFNYLPGELPCDRHEIIAARTPGEAKAIYLRDWAYAPGDITYTELRARLARPGDEAICYETYEGP
jgi:hypothetical protein